MNRELVTLRSSVKRSKPASHSFDATRLKVHPFADNFPLMSPDQLQKLSESILAEGLQENILVSADRTTLIDGRSRLRACGIAGVAPRYSFLPESTSKAETLRIMVSANVQSRELTPGQLAMIGHAMAQELVDLPEEDFANYPPLRDYDYLVPRSFAAAVVGVSSKTLWQAKIILEYNTAVADQVKSGELRLNTAYEQIMADRGLRKEQAVPVDWPKELPKTPPRGKDHTRRAVEARRAWLRHLAGENMSAAEISNRLDISELHVRKLARQYKIDLPGDAWSYKRRRPNFDVNRVAQVVADDLMAMADSIPRIKDNLDQLDPDRIDEWAKIYHRAYRQLRSLAESLSYGHPKKRTNVNNDDSA